MAWEEVKYALNSTIGTAEFMSLDKMLPKTQGAVKSVQRGVTMISDLYYHTVSINIGGVNPAKCLVSIHGDVGLLHSNGLHVATGYVVSLTGGTLTVGESLFGTDAGVRCYFSWEVVEFY